MSEPLRLAIVHYHLKRGGVTRVIESAISGLEALCGRPIQIVVLAGFVPYDFARQDLAIEVPGLEYSNAWQQPVGHLELLSRLKQAAKDQLGDLPDIWHIHNHSLGKNSAMAGVVAELAESGAHLLLQMHDFAEDGRPANYQLIESAEIGTEKLYPQASQIEYAVLNQRDYGHVQTLTQVSRLHCLPNPVMPSSVHGASPQTSSGLLDRLQAEQLILYPVRAVRRKNFGEMLLWASLAPPGTVFANTLGPTNQNYQAAYEDWRSFAQRLNLPIHFSIGESSEYSFESLMQVATAILTTSIAEGFGLAFLEPWLFGKQIIGRDLPEITADFKAKGIELGSLYSSLPIPTSWVQMDALEAELEALLKQSYQAYHMNLPENAVQRSLESVCSEGTIDFGALNETEQKAVIRKVKEDPEARSELQAHLSIPHPEQSLIASNADICTKYFGLSTYADRLHKLYTHLLKQPAQAPTYAEPKELLQSFLKPESFRRLRT